MRSKDAVINESSAGNVMTPVRLRIFVFFIVSYGLTWFGWLGNWLAPSDYWPLPMFPLGPLIAALLVIGFTEGKTGLRAWWDRVKQLRAPLWVYSVAAIVPLCIIVASVILAAAFGAPTRPLEPRGPVEFAILVPIMLLLGPLPEEISFRGYGQHELQETMSPLSTSIWIGVGVLIWHTPVFLLGTVPWPFIVTIVAVSVVYAWLYRSGNSVWPLVLLHFQVNYFGGEWLGRSIAAEGQTTYALFFMTFYLIWVLLIISRRGSRL